MFASRLVRQVVGALFCGAAGLSLTSMVLPSVSAATGLTDAFWARFSLSGYAAHTVLLWAMGGWTLARVGSMKVGGLIMGLLGLACGAGLGYLGIGDDLKTLAILGVSSGIYGLTTGLLVGKVLEDPGGQDEQPPDQPTISD